MHISCDLLMSYRQNTVVASNKLSSSCHHPGIRMNIKSILTVLQAVRDHPIRPHVVIAGNHPVDVLRLGCALPFRQFYLEKLMTELRAVVVLVQDFDNYGGSGA